MLDNINTPRLRALLYGLIVLSSLAVFGNVAELCDLANRCPTRLAVIIAIGVATTIVSIVLFLGMLCQVGVLMLLEFLLSILLLVSFSVCVGLTSSFRTNVQDTIALSFSWVGLALSFVVTFLALTVEGGILRTKEESSAPRRFAGIATCRKRKDLEAGEGVPEEEYMEQFGEMKQEKEEEQPSGDGQVPMVALEENRAGS